MKLLHTSGLLASLVNSQTVDGHFGAYQQIDWSATFNELATLDTA